MEIVTDYAKKRFGRDKGQLIENRRKALRENNKDMFHDLAMQYLESEQNLIQEYLCYTL